MIIIKKVRFKNFLSYGNAFTEVDLISAKKTVIAGTNGVGKSTILSAITFALFGKTIKNINKANIVNSVNGKDCLTEVEFSVSGAEYMVRRGIKPAVFEIYKDGVMLEQTSAYDYQDYLESKILKTNFRAFTQTSIISIENYKPFMSLTKNERREFVEEILDIKVFSSMNLLNKSAMSKTREELKLCDIDIKNAKHTVSLLKNHVQELQKNYDETIAQYDSKDKEFDSELTALSRTMDDLLAESVLLTQKTPELQAKERKLTAALD